MLNLYKHREGIIPTDPLCTASIGRHQSGLFVTEINRPVWPVSLLATHKPRCRRPSASDQVRSVDHRLHMPNSAILLSVRIGGIQMINECLVLRFCSTLLPDFSPPNTYTVSQIKFMSLVPRSMKFFILAGDRLFGLFMTILVKIDWIATPIYHSL
jgi:hypothetical protein